MSAAPVGEVIARLKKEYPDARTALNWSNPLELLVAVILSAQCTDERVNRVTEQLFRKYRTAEDYAGAPLEELEEDIRPTGFYRNKAKALQGMARALLERHGGEVPRTMQELVALPGVGRKTANVVLGNAFGINEGVVVDTHVRRVSRRLGLTGSEDPEKIERDLLPQIPEEERTLFAHLLIFHGRRVCKARRPDCPRCVLNDICPSSGLSGEPS
ncbi:Endonuclease III [Rubrobacter xylanophilus DSM 9941]|uniref:endonuclease III n=1 Tax=Rubrobacter xylanophilus TaxID=49319 RepID=UPI001C63B907|nr:endonuclease III [Rubrobacter xylanophilus]QYJ15728.1 Endonuclease III [Rubrobacter xylanophilus DSM 9941]